MSKVEIAIDGLSGIERDILAGGPRQHERRWLDGLCDKGLMNKLPSEAAEILGHEYEPTALGQKVIEQLKAPPTCNTA